MTEQFSRAELLFGPEAMNRIASARVIVFGMGGVGSWIAETLVRTGIRHLVIVDFDRVAPSNINRQLPALATTIGLPKVDVVRERLLAINPDADISALNLAFNAESAAQFNFNDFDYVVDAIDSLRDKALLIKLATDASCKFFSSMGAALRTDPTRVRVTEFRQVKGDRLAAALRNYFKRSGEFPRRKFKVVCSDEPIRHNIATTTSQSAVSTSVASPEQRQPNGSLMQVTAVFGITLASLVINDLAALRR